MNINHEQLYQFCYYRYVSGPNSLAKCHIIPQPQGPQPEGRFAVSYVPVEVGTYSVTVRWDGKNIPGVWDIINIHDVTVTQYNNRYKYTYSYNSYITQ